MHMYPNWQVLESAVNGAAVTTEGESMIRGNKQNLAPIPIGLAVFMCARIGHVCIWHVCIWHVCVCLCA